MGASTQSAWSPDVGSVPTQAWAGAGALIGVASSGTEPGFITA